MATQLQLRRGTNAQVTAFTGAEGEVSVNTTNDSLHIHDGSTAGGFELARADLNNVSDTDLNAALTGNTVSALTITTLTLGSTAITATGTEINLLDGVTATTAELNYVDGVTSSIQTQLDAKAPTANPTFTGTLAAADLTADSLAVDTDTLYVDATNNRVGIGTTSPNDLLHIKSTSADAEITLESTSSGGDARLRMIANSSGISSIQFQDEGDSNIGFVNYDHSDNSMRFRTNDAERMRIDSSGNVGIGTTPKAWTAFVPVLQIKNASTGGGGALAGTSADNFRMFANTYYDGSYKRLATGFATQYGQESGNHVWSYAASGAADSTFTWSEAMRIDSSGNLLVGTTTISGVGGSSTPEGVVLDGNNAQITVGTSSDVCATFNRQTTDGAIVQFRKDGSSVGSIGTTSGTFWIGSGDVGLVFDNATANSEQIRPYNTASGTRDAAIDLGNSTGRFKRLYLSNQIIGGFGAQTTSGTLDWNHSTNARSGMGTTLLLGTATNGPGPSTYFHPVSFEYSSKDGSGNMTQLAIGYTNTRIFMRYRYSNSWSSWTEI